MVTDTNVLTYTDNCGRKCNDINSDMLSVFIFLYESIQISVVKEELQIELDTLQKHFMLLNTSLLDKVNTVTFNLFIKHQTSFLFSLLLQICPFPLRFNRIITPVILIVNPDACFTGTVVIVPN